MILNKAQAQELARFFFDVAKGLVLGGVGFATVNSLELKVLATVSSLMLSYICVKIGLFILKEIK